MWLGKGMIWLGVIVFFLYLFAFMWQWVLEG